MKAIKNYKIILFIFILFNSSFVFSQNWNLINIGRAPNFELPNGNVMLYRIGGNENNFTKIFPKRNSGSVVWADGNTYYENSVFGHHYFKKSNEWDILIAPIDKELSLYTFTGLIDSIFIKKKTFLGDSWQFTKTTTSNFVASVTRIGVETFLGISDSVRTILVTSSLNSFTGIIKLSKNYGFLQALSLNCFPEKIEVLTVIGFQNLAGFQDFGAKEIFNFDVGDEFMYRTKELKGLIRFDEFIFKKVLTKTETSQDFIYSIFSKTFTGYIVNQGLVNQAFICTEKDSITKNVTYSKNFAFTNSIPSSSNCYKGKFMNMLFITKDSLKTYNLNDQEMSENTDYKVGFGKFSSSFSGRIGNGFTNLVYYKKQNSLMGVKLDFELTSISNPSNINQTFSLIPNPSQGTFKIIIPTEIKQLKVKICKITGESIYEKEYANSSEGIEISGLHAGVFVVSCQAENKIWHQKVVVY